MRRVRDQLMFQRMRIKTCLKKWVSGGCWKFGQNTDRYTSLMVSFCWTQDLYLLNHCMIFLTLFCWPWLPGLLERSNRRKKKVERRKDSWCEEKIIIFLSSHLYLHSMHFNSCSKSGQTLYIQPAHCPWYYCRQHCAVNFHKDFHKCVEIIDH